MVGVAIKKLQEVEGDCLCKYFLKPNGQPYAKSADKFGRVAKASTDVIRTVRRRVVYRKQNGQLMTTKKRTLTLVTPKLLVKDLVIPDLDCVTMIIHFRQKQEGTLAVNHWMV